MENPPPYFTPTKDRRGQIIALACVVLLGLCLVWTVMANLRQSLQSPQMRSALSALKSKSPAEARTLFESALRTAPNDPALYVEILEACQKDGYWDLIVLFGERAVWECRESPEGIRAALYGQLVQGYTKAKGKEWKQLACDAARRAYEIEPLNPSNQNLLGYTLTDTFDSTDKAHSNSQDLEEAQILITRAMNNVRTNSPLKGEDPNLAMYEDSYAWLMVKRGRYAEAASLLNDIVTRVDPTVFGDAMKELHYHLGVAYSRMGHENAARQSLAKALAYDPKFKDAKAELYRLPGTSLPTPTKKN